MRGRAKFRENLTGTIEDATLVVMDQQGAGSAGAGRRRPWQPPPGSSQYGESPSDSDDPYDETLPGTGSRPAHGPRHGSGPMPAAQNGYRPDSDSTGAYATGAAGTGAYAAADPRYAGPPGSGPRPTQGTASGPQPMYGARSGPQSVLGPGSGPLRALDRDPARGFPPRGPQQEHAADSWYSPAGGYPAGSYSPPVPAPPAPPPQPAPAPPLPPADSYATGAFSPSASDYATETFSVPADSYAQDYRPNEPRYDYQPDDDSATWPPLDSAPEPWSEPPRRRVLRRPAVIGAIAVLVVAALGAGGYYKFVYAPHSATIAADNSLKLPTTDSTAGNPYFSKKLGPYQHIDTRKLDPVQLSLDELYLPAFTISGNEYVKATANLTKTCGDAVFGEPGLPTCQAMARSWAPSGSPT
jgi:hypothetical protein